MSHQQVRFNNSQALLNAASDGDLSTVQTLLNSEDDHRDVLDINARDDQGCTSLLLAVAGGHREIVDALLDANALVHLAASDGESPLHMAVRQNTFPLVQRLINAGANVNVQDMGGSTPLHVAAWHGLSTMVSTLLQHGANPALQDLDGDVPAQLVTMSDTNVPGANRARTLAVLTAATPPALLSAERLDQQAVREAFEGEPSPRKAYVGLGQRKI